MMKDSTYFSFIYMHTQALVEAIGKYIYIQMWG